MQFHAIPAFADNYLWTLVDGDRAVVVDPGDAAPVEAFLDRSGLRLQAILITHHHPDHVGGVTTLLQHREIPVYGPLAEAATIPGITQALVEGDQIEALGRRFDIIAVPGHTLGHIAYHSPGCGPEQPGVLLCGDTLFSAGCGRLFEGTPEQMYHSLQRLAALPGDTEVYCTHEYTLANIAFARAVEPRNQSLADHERQVRQRRKQGLPSLPTRLDLERRINPFLRADVADVRDAAAHWSGHAASAPVDTFAVLRHWKDGFRAN